MVRIEPACVNCPPEICQGQTCTRKVYECDLCNRECFPGSSDRSEWLYDVEGDDLCWSCMVETTGIRKVE